MKSQRTIERRLRKLERILSEQLERITESGEGFGGPAALMWDARVLERRHLRWVLGKRYKAFCSADMMAGW